MKAILDTNRLLWWVSEPGRLNARVRGLLTDHENQIYLSAISALDAPTTSA